MKRVYACAELREKENFEQIKEYSRYVLMRGCSFGCTAFLSVLP